MMLSGLLWFDDDTRRPLPQKIAQAATRYRERVGYIPTLVEVNPQQATITTLVVTPEIADDLLARTGKRGGKRGAKAKGVTSLAPAKGRGARKAAAPVVAPTPADAPTVRVEPNPTLRPNYFLVGIAVGEQPIRAPEYIAEDEDLAPVASATPAGRASASSTRRPRARRATAEAPKVAATAAPNASATPLTGVASQAAGRPAIAPREPAPTTDTSPQRATRATERDRHTSKPSPATAAPKPLAAPLAPTMQPTQPAPKRGAKRTPKREVERASAPSITAAPEPRMTPMRKRSARSTPTSPASAATPPMPQARVAPVAATPMRTPTAATAPNERATPQTKARRMAHMAAQATPTLDAPLAAETPSQAKATRTRKTPHADATLTAPAKASTKVSAKVSAKAPTKAIVSAPEPVATQRHRPARKAATARQLVAPPVASMPPIPPTSQTASPTAKRTARTASQRHKPPTVTATLTTSPQAEAPAPKHRIGKVTRAASDVPTIQPLASALRKPALRKPALAPQPVPAKTPTRRTARRSATTSASITQIALPFGAVEATADTPAKQPLARSTRSTQPTKITAPTSDHASSTKTTQPPEAITSVIPPLKAGVRKAMRPTKPVSSVA